LARFFHNYVSCTKGSWISQYSWVWL
jgi:hypothetical protein